MNTNQLTGLSLNYMVARALGYIWAVNLTNDADTAAIPVGTRAFVAVQYARPILHGSKDTHGLTRSVGTEPIAPHWDFMIPNFADSWSVAGYIMDKYKPSIDTNPGGLVQARVGNNQWTEPTDSILVAVMRAVVINTYGAEFEFDEFTPPEIFHQAKRLQFA
jgi:hypothetical protein